MSSDENGSGEGRGWTWDPSLYAGSAGYYTVGRLAYPAEVADALVAALGLDGAGRLLDVGCGPGSLTLLLAPHFAEAIGVDADAEMLTEAARLAEAKQVRNVSWRHLRAEDLPADLPPVRGMRLWSCRGLPTSAAAVGRVAAACRGGGPAARAGQGLTVGDALDVEPAERRRRQATRACRPA